MSANPCVSNRLPTLNAMKLTALVLRRAAGLGAGVLLTAAAAAAPAAPAAPAAVPATKPAAGKEADAFPVFENSITIGGYLPYITGSDEAFQARTQKAEQGAAGIEDLSFLYDLGDKTSAQVDGKAL